MMVAFSMVDVMKIVNYYTRCCHPVLVTPPLGSEGDKCDRTFEGECDVDFILRKYGTLGDSSARFGVYGDFSNLPSDLVDLRNYTERIRGLMRDGESIDDFIARLSAGEIDENADKSAESVNDEKKENVEAAESQGVPEGQSS